MSDFQDEMEGVNHGFIACLRDGPRDGEEIFIAPIMSVGPPIALILTGDDADTEYVQTGCIYSCEEEPLWEDLVGAEEDIPIKYIFSGTIDIGQDSDFTE